MRKGWFPEILKELGATIAYSTYQAGKLIMISSHSGASIIKYAKNFKRPMGIAYDENKNKLALASRTYIDVFSSSRKLALSYPPKPRKHDYLFLPQAKYYTSHLDTHEISWYQDELWVVNTLFSCLCTMSDDKNFVPKWKPEFVTELLPEDRCHLNGFALENGEPAYVTCFAKSNEKNGWRNMPYDSGMIIDIRTNEILLKGLSMPHSPVAVGGKIYFLQSATGQVMFYDLKTKVLTELNQFNTFVRGLEVVENYLFVGASKIREESTTFGNLPVKAEDSFCGIIVLDKETGKQVSGLNYTDVVKEIFSLKILRGVISPAILTENDELYDKSITVGEDLNFWLSKKERNKLP